MTMEESGSFVEIEKQPHVLIKAGFFAESTHSETEKTMNY